MAEAPVFMRASLHSPTYFMHDGTYYIADKDGNFYAAPGDVQALIWLGCQEVHPAVVEASAPVTEAPAPVDTPEPVVTDGELGPPEEGTADDPLSEPTDGVVGGPGDPTPETGAG